MKKASTPIPSPRNLSREDLDTIELVPLIHTSVPRFATRSYSHSLRSDSLESIKVVKSRSVSSQTEPKLDPNFVEQSDIACQTNQILLQKSDLNNLATKTDLQKFGPRVRFPDENKPDKRILSTVQNIQDKLCCCFVPILLVGICVLIVTLIILAKIYNGA